MAQPFSTGPALIWVGSATSKTTPTFFGTAEGFPRIELRPEYEPVMNDLSGSRVPFDYSFQGESGAVSLIMTRWNESVAQRLENVPNPLGTLGSYDLTDVGTLMGLEQFAFPVWVQFINAGKKAMAGMPGGYHFYQSIVWSPQVIEPGTRPMKRHFMMMSWPLYIPATRKFVLYDYDTRALSPSAIN